MASRVAPGKSLPRDRCRETGLPVERGKDRREVAIGKASCLYSPQSSDIRSLEGLTSDCLLVFQNSQYS
jgi:hypothetical protein